jgi:hypothetical protein
MVKNLGVLVTKVPENHLIAAVKLCVYNHVITPDKWGVWSHADLPTLTFLA